MQIQQQSAVESKGRIINNTFQHMTIDFSIGSSPVGRIDTREARKKH